MNNFPHELDPRLNAYRPDLADIALKGAVNSETYATSALFMVHAPSAPMHQAPDSRSMMINAALMGETIKVFEHKQDWCWGQLATDHYVGYLPSRMLTPISKAYKPDHHVIVPRTFVYPDADLRHPPLCALSIGNQLKVTGAALIRYTAYKQVKLPDGRAGAVIARHIAPLSQLLPDWVATAELFVHTPYLWGGRSGFGIDCSALVQLSRQLSGLKTPRDSDMQAHEGQELAIHTDLSGLQRGDLVFWPGHVGIMLDATRLLHANGFHMSVAIEPLHAVEMRIARHYGTMSGARRLPN